jgi:hypothetical protein
MEKDKMKLKRFLTVSQFILLFSAFMDLFLWFTTGYYIPCFAVALFSISIIMLLEVIKWLLKNI